ncbi:hypothetical protein PVAP13_5KG075461 [Panicum virgatum]|uniref:Uncharacterized protein n=1 Tax=Panicum virgatum TaxID=38727 RepID=A0A8T0SB35_PANVG|nr:hypothetical protein PVAP13_5KG075461 [Panicum virgatum]
MGVQLTAASSSRGDCHRLSPRSRSRSALSEPVLSTTLRMATVAIIMAQEAHAAVGRVGRSRRPPLPHWPLRGGYGRSQRSSFLDSVLLVGLLGLDRPRGLRWPSFGLNARGGNDVFLQEFRVKALPDSFVGSTPAVLYRRRFSFFQAVLRCFLQWSTVLRVKT